MKLKIFLSVLAGFVLGVVAMWFVVQQTTMKVFANQYFVGVMDQANVALHIRAGKQMTLLTNIEAELPSYVLAVDEGFRGHAGSTNALWGAVLHGGISVDQGLANHIGQDSIQPSMVLGCEQPITGYHESNFSMAYSSHITWQNADSPVPMEVYPSLAFDSLFENRGTHRTQSILDRVKDDASSLGRKISGQDKAKLDEYLTSVREVEKRIDRMRGDQAKAEKKLKARVGRSP